MQFSFYGNSSYPGVFRAPITRPIDFSAESNHFYSLHQGGGNWLLGDGSVRFMSYSGQPITLLMATRAGNEVIPGNAF